MKAIDKEIFSEWWMPEPNSGCWLWIRGSVNFGYGTVPIRATTRIAHRMSWLLYRGEIPKQMCVLHQCDTPACVNPDHLFLGTRVDNNADRDKKGRHIAISGNRHGMSKATSDIVAAIRSDARKRGIIAKVYGLSPSTVYRIKTRKAWKND